MPLLPDLLHQSSDLNLSMALRPSLLLAVTAVCCFTTIVAFPMDGFATENKCKCQTTTSSKIPPRLFQRIEILPAGAHCRKAEILITKKDNQTVCVHPEARWVKDMVSKIISKRAERKTAEPTVA
ncbi:interleukin-8 [Danio aesculapii]|uniref:interleukin-8 n=1 Tax=Danio aesculapii TaxID=1142201 RepID=UPI0024BF3734|nr:interleukin-8 [Danio aesculapii]